MAYGLTRKMQNVRKTTGWWALSLCILSVGALAQESGEVYEPEYRLALPGYVYEFPRDHGAHPEYKLEWWYYTGHLDAEDGRRFGYELTFFRIGMDRRAAIESAWAVDDLYMVHFALSRLSEGEFQFWERVNRAGPGIAHARRETLDLKNESWTAILEDGVMRLRAYADGVLLELELTSDKPPVVHGTDGISQKADGVGRASHYYSMTRMETRGLLSIDGQAVRVSGQSWMDHEFGTNQLSADQVGWDWFSLQLDNGEELMLYQMRLADGGIDPNSSATLVGVDGEALHLGADTFVVRSLRDWASPRSEAVYRLDWEVELPELDTSLKIVPLMDDQELFTVRSTGLAYWEGAVRIEGSWKGEAITGRGYVELTGYSDRYRPEV
jgi:predicted secreted hydrolase